MPGLDPKHLPVAMHVVTLALLGWVISTAKVGVDTAISAAHRLPVVEQVVADQGRRIDRLEAMEGKLDGIAESVAAIRAEVRRR